MHLPYTTKPALAAGFLAVSMLSGNASAAHSDIGIEGVHDGHIVLHTEAQPIDYQTGNAIFEAVFGDGNPLLPHLTANPGFATHDHDDEEHGGNEEHGEHEELDPLTAGNFLNYRALGTLSYWDGNSWGAADANTSVHVLGNFFEDSIYSSAGLSGNAFGLIQQVAGDGSVHSHVDFCVENQGLSGCPDTGAEITGNSPAVGAYLVEMSLFETDSYDGTLIGNVVAESDPFFIVFNNGLLEDDFEAGIDTLTAVPVPAAFWLFASALLVATRSMGRSKA